MGQLIFSIAALKRAFGTFEWAKPATDAFVMNEYLDHYGLRFRSDARYVHGFFPATNYKIATQAWLPPKPVGSLFVVHGYFDHVGLYRHLINWALNQELAVFAFDLPGHGLSSGPAAAIDDFQEYQTVFQAMLSLAKEQMPRPWHAVGQSTGAGILADYALQQVGQTDQSLFSQTVLLAPLLRVTSWGAITMTWQLLRRFQNHVPRSFAKNSHDQDFMNFQQYEDPLQSRRVSTQWVGAMIQWARRMESAQACSHVSPLIIQGEEDTTVDFAFNLPIYESKFPSAKIFRLPEARHHLVNESEPFRKQIFDVMAEHLF